MRAVEAIREFALVTVLAFAVTAAVSYTWSALAHGEGTVAWAAAVRLAIVLGIVVPWVHARRRG